MNQENEIARACYEHITSGGNKKYVTIAVIKYHADVHEASFNVFAPSPCMPVRFIAMPHEPDTAPWIDGELIERKSERVVGYIKSWQGDDAGNMPIMYFGQLEALTNKDRKKLTIKLSDGD